MKRVLLFARDPGGANAVAPLAEKLRLRGHEPLLYGKDAALKQYRNAGLDGLDLNQEAPVMGVAEYEEFLRRIAPDFMITGTGSDDFAEKYLWKAAEHLEIPCFALLDHWFNYGIRFSPYKLVEQKLYEQDRRHPYLPTQILVMDETVRADMINEGFAAELIRVAGQPHFDALREQASRFDAKARTEYRTAMGLGESDFLLAFISENVTEPEKGDDLTQYDWGYTERSIFREALAALEPAAFAAKRRVRVVVKPHPNETIDSYSDLIAGLSGEWVSAIVDASVHPVRLCKAADLVCGMSSMVLVEAVILGLPVMSVQIGLLRDNPFVLAKKGVLASIVHPADLRRKLSEALNGNPMTVSGFEAPQGAAERIIGWMEEWQ